jgi:hypothetical protein
VTVKTIREESGAQLMSAMRASRGTPRNGRTPLRPSRSCKDRPVEKVRRLGPLVRGSIRSPASRRSGAATSTIGGKLGRATSSIQRRSGDTRAWGVGGASTISATARGGSL